MSECKHGVPLYEYCPECFGPPPVCPDPSAEITRLRAALAEAKGLVIEANNSLYGSQNYFHSMNGGAYDKHHLSRGIEALKERTKASSQIRAEALREGYDTGFANSGEGYNGEYGADVESDYYISTRTKSLEELNPEGAKNDPV